MRRAAATGGRCVLRPFCFLLLVLAAAAAAVASASSSVHPGARLPVVRPLERLAVVPCCATDRRLNCPNESITTQPTQVPGDARRRAQEQQRSGRRPPFGPAHVRQAHLPVAMMGGIVEGIGNSIRRLREGTADLMGNAKQLGSLKCVRCKLAVGYLMDMSRPFACPSIRLALINKPKPHTPTTKH